MTGTVYRQVLEHAGTSRKLTTISAAWLIDLGKPDEQPSVMEPR